MMMGSSNGAARGQLRPYLSGRSPPFILVGLLVILGILGFSYHSLNTQYNDLLTEMQKLEERLRVYAEKRESVEKINSALQAEIQTHKDENKKFRVTMYNKDQELNTISEQLRNKEDDLSKANLHIESLKTDLENIDSRDKQKDIEIGSLQDQAKSLKVENQELADANAELLKKMELLQKAADSSITKDSGKITSNSVLQEQSAHKPDIPSLNPDEGMPPQNKEIKFQPQVPELSNSVHEEPKVQTTIPESPDISNLERIPDVTSKVQLNDPVNNANDLEPQVPAENRNSV